MKPGMSSNQIRDYTSILNVHLLPEFGDQPFDFIGLAFADEIFRLGRVTAAGRGLENVGACGCYQFDELGQVFTFVFVAGIHVDQNRAIAGFGAFKQAWIP